MKDYLKYIKSKHCLVCGVSPVDPDHLEHIGMGNNRSLQSSILKNYTCVSLCRKHHTERHDLGLRRFEKKYNINLWKEAFYLLRGYFAE
tara:strand:+ start:353 stop:619 length:267 start_codon:yes stop_codon:yes gene_type:complete